MESRLYMHLCLPNFLGGCAFPKAVLNKPVKVDSKQYYLDLYFPDTRLGIEYDSYEYHNNSKSFSQDNLRDAKLRTAGYRLIHVTPGQLNDLEGFQDLVVNISRQLKKPIVIRTTKFFEPFKEIFHFTHLYPTPQTVSTYGFVTLAASFVRILRICSATTEDSPSLS